MTAAPPPTTTTTTTTTTVPPLPLLLPTTTTTWVLDHHFQPPQHHLRRHPLAFNVPRPINGTKATLQSNTKTNDGCHPRECHPLWTALPIIVVVVTTTTTAFRHSTAHPWDPHQDNLPLRHHLHQQQQELDRQRRLGHRGLETIPTTTTTTTTTTAIRWRHQHHHHPSQQNDPCPWKT